jgi:hypothetical protein
MKTLSPSRPSGKFAVGADALMAVLLLVALLQIALAFGTEAGSVRNSGQSRAAAEASTRQTTAPVAGSQRVAAKDKSISFEFAATRD